MRYLFSHFLRRKPYSFFLLGWIVLLSPPLTFAASCLDIPQTASVEKSAFYAGESSLDSSTTTTESCRCYLNGTDKTEPDAQFLSYSNDVQSGRYIFSESSCKDENDNSVSLNAACGGKFNGETTYYFQNITESNEYFACSSVNDAIRFNAYRVGLKKCDDGRFIDSSGDCAASHVGPEFKTVPEIEQYTLSVAGDQVHIRSVAPNVGIDCQYGQGVCSYAFNTDLSVDLEIVDIKTDVGLTIHDYDANWSGHADCSNDGDKNKRIYIYKNKYCEVIVSKKQYVKDREEANANQLSFLNFSGHGISRGGAEDVVLGFILENSGTAYMQPYVEGLDYVIQANGAAFAPQADFYQVLYDQSAGSFYGKLLYGKSANTSTFYQSEKTLQEGIYTMLLYPSDPVPQNYRRGMIGISLRNAALTLSNLSVRGHLHELIGLNFIVDGVGSRKMKISSNILQGQVETQLIL
ncbi:hypothetical protein, partial [Candidatus Albibeggiatoa sp. nov. BB20]|uniref:hypothetical protein n=1 Tax=Candidatus Albibeggiatoa sp. nov. BB20 TaxID=3162723 RepID=UPI003365504E